MTKKQIRNRLASRFGLTQLAVGAILDGTLAAIREALARGERVELRGFGAFDVAERAAYRAHDPRTREFVDVPARRVVTFRPGKGMVAGPAAMAEALGPGEVAP